MSEALVEYDPTVQRELGIIDFWRREEIFKQSVESRPKNQHYVFYDGPPFATGMPHYGHLLGSTLKDVIPRFWTMKGYRVERVWGWDCHGLPIENMVEKELSIKGGKKGIETLGIAEFCVACRNAVLRLDHEWRRFIERIGRFVDMEHSYKTMDPTFIESVWWAFKTLWEKGLIYEGRRVILYCPRCATPLSNFEIAMDNSYQEVEDDSLYVKFEVIDPRSALNGGYFLAWTTTPWTLPGNVALAVDKEAEYVQVKIKRSEERLVLEKGRLVILKEPYEIVSEFKGQDLLGLLYKPLYDFLPLGGKKAYYVLPADFIDSKEGTGIVHTAAVYGEEDYELAVRADLPTIPMLDEEGKFLDFTKVFAGKFFKQANPLVIADLEERGLLYRQEKLVHSYPFCYRCDTPLFYNAIPAWFLDVQKLKKELLAQNEKINWYPSHYKHGQFKNILQSSPDWNISRSRYWGSPMPVWQCSKCHQREIFGSIKELRGRSSQPERIGDDFDPHRPFIDEINTNCSCGGEMKRIAEVFDCWFESSSMPFAAKHYPFENKKWFEENYPADFIGEYSGQVRAWFNVLHRMSVALFGKPSFKNVSVTGVYLGTDGKKLSKSRHNFPDPMTIANRYGVDALRFYMMGSPVMKGEDVIFSEEAVKESRNQFINIFYNCFNFLRLYDGAKFEDHWPLRETQSVLDRWIISRTEQLISKVTSALETYDTLTTCDQLRDYISDLSTWYLRRSRNCLRAGGPDSLVARKVLGAALLKLTKVAAPVVPFVTEFIYRDLTGNLSVHLEFWPKTQAGLIDFKLEEDMELVREVVEKGHAARKVLEIKVRQPLSKIEVKSNKTKPSPELEKFILEELNIKALVWESSAKVLDLQVELDEEITNELREEGVAREIIRSVQDLRKDLGYSVKDRIILRLPSWPKSFEDYIKTITLAERIEESDKLGVEIAK